MSEAKKVPLTTVPYDKGKSKCKKQCKTIRFSLSLTESNENSCSEFNYGELLTEHFHKKFVKDLPIDEVINGPDLHPNDPFNGQNDLALKSLAKQFEKKYGTTISGKKKKKKSTDFDVLGQGYDESDPFIDNSDALDDVVPKNVVTKFGGFYINSGELDFHEVQASDDDSGNVNVRRKKRKVIESSDEEEESYKKEKINGYVNDKYDEGEIHRRRKKLIHKFNAKKHKLPNSLNGDEDNENPLPGSSMETSIAASIEAVINKVRGSGTNEKVQNEQEEAIEGDDEEPIREATTTASSSSSSSSSESSSSDSESEEDENREDPSKKIDSQVNSLPFTDPGRCSSPEGDEIVPLPDSLSTDLILVLDKIKEVGRNSRGSSQKFFTDPQVNKMLLSIEVKLNKLGGGRNKTQVYKHLAGHLPCGIQTIIKRGKNLLSERLEGRLKDPMNRLKDAICKAMPSLLAAYTLECKNSSEEKVENHKDSEGQDADKKAKNSLPKKKFSFTEDAITSLCEVIKVRCQGWHMIKKRNEDPEEHVKSFIDETIKPLWPKGWISTKLLYKMSQSAHYFITNKKTVSLPVETLPNAPINQEIQSTEKSVLSYEPVELPYHLEKMVKNEITKNGSVRLSSTESTVVTNVELPVSQQISPEKKINANNKQYTNEKAVLDPVIITTKEQQVKSFSDSGKPLKTEESVIKVVQPFNFTKETFKGNKEAKPFGNYLSKVSNNSDPVIDCRPPKPSLSATPLLKINHSTNIIESKEGNANVNEHDRKTVTCINIKSVDKINEAPSNIYKGIHLKKSTEVTRTAESVSIMDLSVGKNKKHEPSVKQITSSLSDNNISSDDCNNEVVDLCMKSSPVKNVKLEQEMDKVMNDLLEISRTIQGTPEPSPQRTTITPPLKDLSSSGHRYIDGDKVDRVPSTCLPRYGDVDKLDRVKNVSLPRCTDREKGERVQHKSQTRFVDGEKVERVPNSSLPRYKEGDKLDRIPSTSLSKGNSESSHSVITSSIPKKSFSSEYMDSYKLNKTSQANNESPSIYRQSNINQDIPYKPKTVFQESYLAQRFPSKMTTGTTNVSHSQSNTSIKNVSSTPGKVTTPDYSSSKSNNAGPPVAHTSNIHHINITKNIVSPTKNIAEITIHRPSVSTVQRIGPKISVQPSESVNRLPSSVTMHHVTSSTHAESLSRPKNSNSSQGHHNSNTISVNFNASHNAITKIKPHSTTHFPTNHSIQSLSQSSSSHRYDTGMQAKPQSGQVQADTYRSNRNPSERQPQKGFATDPLANLRLMQGLSVSSVSKKAAAHSTTTATSSSQPSVNLATSSRKNAVPSPDQKGKHGSEKVGKLPTPSIYSNLSPDQMEALRSSSQHQQEFWKHINASGYFTGLSPSDAMRYMNQSGQYTGNGSGSSKQGQY